ncbi:MAG: hypothetical protein RL338_1725 [Chloroflexota bacterium]
MIPPAFRAASAGLVLALTLAVPPAAVAAEEVRFDVPTASAEWGEGILFEQLATLEVPAIRAELLIATPFTVDEFLVADVGPQEPGRVELVHQVDAALGALLPNTTLIGRWRITLEDGGRILGPEVRATYEDTRFEWRSLAGDVVRVHWHVGSEAFGRRALAIGERAVSEAAALLGVEERLPVDFFIYASTDELYDALGPGIRENVGGQANPELRTLFALIRPEEIDDDWVSVVITHELAHLVFDTAVRNPYHYPPSWLNEGLAVYLAEGYGPSDRDEVADAIRDGTLLPLEALTGQFPTTRERFSLAYAESVSAIDFLVRTEGTAALVELIRAYGAGKSDDEAMRAATGRSTAEFAAAWLADLGATAPVRYGPRVPPPGPLPAGWTGPAPTAGIASPGPVAPTPTDSTDEGAGAGPASTGLPGGMLVALVALVSLGIAGGFLLARARRRIDGAEPAEADPFDEVPADEERR